MGTDHNGGKGKATATGKRAAVGSFLALIGAHFIVDSVGQSWVIFKKLENLDVARAGLIFMISVMGAQLLQPFFGLWADRGRRRELVLVGVAVVPVALLLGIFGRDTALMNSATGYGVMFAVILLSKLGSSLFHPAAGSAASEGDPSRRHARLGLFVASGMAGMALGQWIFSAVYHITDKHPEWLYIPIYSFVFFALFAFRPPARRIAGAVTPRALAKELHAVAGRLFPLWMLQVLSGASIVCLHFLLPELAEERGCSPVWVNGGAVFVQIAGTAIMTTPMGHLADRFGHGRVGTACLVGGAALYFVVVLGGNLPLWWFAVCLFVYGGIHGSVGPILIAHAQHIVSDHRSMTTGVMMGWAWAASAPATWLAGSLVAHGGLSHAHAMAWMGIPGVLAAVMAFVVSRR